MEKFSLFELLSILLPGVVIVYFFGIFTKILSVDLLIDFSELNNIGEIGTGLCLALTIGGLLFVITDKLKDTYLYKNIFGIYKPIGEIFYQIKNPQTDFFKSLNNRSKELFDEEIFFSKDVFSLKEGKDKLKFIKLQSDFFSIAYYDLLYADKIEYPKTYQSYYFLFRQLVTACLMMVFISAIFFWKLPFYNSFIIITICIVFLGITIVLARYFRIEMIKKIYIMYSIHLIKKQ